MHSRRRRRRSVSELKVEICILKEICINQCIDENSVMQLIETFFCLRSIDWLLITALILADSKKWNKIK